MAEIPKYEDTGKAHPYHIVRPSPWPLVASIAAGLLAMGLVFFMHDTEFMGIQIGWKVGVVGLLGVLAVMFFWWKDIIFETVKEKAHTPVSELGMRYGMILFILSEIMFFVAFFWAFFAGALYPTEGIGHLWPPEGTHIVPPFDLPLLMTMILLLSGSAITWAHHEILRGNNETAARAIKYTVILGFIFLGFQIYEYAVIGMGFGENYYTSVFYMATGFHGFHVFVGAVFLWVIYFRTKAGHFTADKHFGFEAAAWYWHFVDVVWLFLYVAVYIWGNTIGTDHSGLY